MRLLSALCAAFAIAGTACASASGASASLESQVRTSGSVSVVWHGDAARGCAAAGACDLSGVIVFRPVREGGFDFGTTNGHLGLVGTSTSGYAAAAVRVRRDGPDGPATCAQSLPAEDSGPDLQGPHGGPLTLDVAGGEFGQGISSGRCAGPVAADLAGVLPTVTVRLSVLLRGARLDLSGRRPFAAGPFSGEVVSDVVVRIGRAHRRAAQSGHGQGGSSSTSSGPRGRATVRVTTRTTLYRFTSFDGSATADYAGGPAPGCVPFDACSSTGTTTYALHATGGELEVTSSRILGAHGRRLARRLHIPIVAGAQAEGYAELAGASASVTGGLDRPGTSSCRDGEPAQPAALDVTGTGRRIRIVLGRHTGDGSDAEIRTRCAGPEIADVLGDAPLAVGTPALPVRPGTRSTVELSGSGGFARGGYSGTYRSHFAAGLRLVRSTTRTETVHFG